MPRNKNKKTQKTRFKKSLKALDYILKNGEYQNLAVLLANLHEFLEQLRRMQPKGAHINARSFLTNLLWFVSRKQKAIKSEVF